MDTVDRISELMEERGIKNNAQLARLAGLPYTTIRSMFERKGKITLATLTGVKKALGVSLDDLVICEGCEKKENTEPDDCDMTFEESEILRKYRSATEKTQGIIQGILLQEDCQKKA
jgi:DNA-binding Xre family transcriptional regulator